MPTPSAEPFLVTVKCLLRPAGYNYRFCRSLDTWPEVVDFLREVLTQGYVEVGEKYTHTWSPEDIMAVEIQGRGWN